MKLITKCAECNQSHINSWLEVFSPKNDPPKFIENITDIFIYRLGSLRSDFTKNDIQLRTYCFAKEAEKRGITVKILKTSFGYTNYLQTKKNGKVSRFELMPIVSSECSREINIINNKGKTKKLLEKHGFPIAKSKNFNFFQKNRALKENSFPLVVKPINGSLNRHVTLNIRNRKELEYGINRSLQYSPNFMVEKFIDAPVHRATVVDGVFRASLKRDPANVVGDGVSTVEELITIENKNPKRVDPTQKGFTNYKIIADTTLCNLQYIPNKKEIVYVQRYPFLQKGGDLIDTTDKTHIDNVKLFEDITKVFNVKIVGIDFLVHDISKSWKQQECAVLELNSAPSFDLHHFPTYGKSRNVAKYVVDMFEKYY